MTAINSKSQFHVRTPQNCLWADRIIKNANSINYINLIQIDNSYFTLNQKYQQTHNRSKSTVKQKNHNKKDKASS